MNTKTENQRLKELLADYSAPTQDDGFKDRFLTRLKRPEKIAKARIWTLGFSAMLGAVVAGGQFLKLRDWVISHQMQIDLASHFEVFHYGPNFSLFGILGIGFLSVFALYQLFFIRESL